MGRIDIVVFPSGNREIFGQIKDAPAERLLTLVDVFTDTLEPSNNPRKFTGYYDAPDASDIEWQPYDSNNPIVLVPTEADGEEFVEGSYAPVELAQIPKEQRDALDNLDPLL